MSDTFGCDADRCVCINLSSGQYNTHYDLPESLQTIDYVALKFRSIALVNPCNMEHL